MKQIDTGNQAFLGHTPEWITNGIMNLCFPTVFKNLIECRVTTWPFCASVEYRPKINWRGVPQPLDEVMIKRNYRQHCADVLRNCPKDKLLALEGPNCGWEVICKFLG